MGNEATLQALGRLLPCTRSPLVKNQEAQPRSSCQKEGLLFKATGGLLTETLSQYAARN